MLDYRVKIGLVAMRRNTTDRPRGTFLTWYSAEQREKKNLDYIESHVADGHVSFTEQRGLGHNDLIFDAASAQAVVERFRRENVDAVMIINCNFGNEEAAADIAQALGKPVLLWAPLDDEYYADGMRPTDSQCGLFGVSRQLQRFHIPFSHLPCCRNSGRALSVSCALSAWSKISAGCASVSLERVPRPSSRSSGTRAS